MQSTTIKAIALPLLLLGTFSALKSVNPAQSQSLNPNKPQNSQLMAAKSNNLSTQILAVHNQERSQVNVSPLTWSDTLANHAQQWANQLATRGSFEHSQGSGEGENLWMGTSGYFSYTQMVQSWAEEKQYFRYGVFPNVSTTGNWVDVGHYTQMIWRNTTQIGCAVATGNGNDVLVCRYSPPGNFMKQKPY